jgi:hypothetical protein
MKWQRILLLVLSIFFLCEARAQSADTTQQAKLQKLIGLWDVYSAEGKEIIGEFLVSPLGKTSAVQTVFKLPAMNMEVNGSWAYDPELHAIVVFEVTSTGDVRMYKGGFISMDVLSLEGFSKQKPVEVVEKSSLTWVTEDKIRVWSNDLKAAREATVWMIKRKRK